MNNPRIDEQIDEDVLRTNTAKKILNLGREMQKEEDIKMFEKMIDDMIKRNNEDLKECDLGTTHQDVFIGYDLALEELKLKLGDKLNGN